LLTDLFAEFGLEGVVEHLTEVLLREARYLLLRFHISCYVASGDVASGLLVDIELLIGLRNTANDILYHSRDELLRYVGGDLFVHAYIAHLQTKSLFKI